MQRSCRGALTFPLIPDASLVVGKLFKYAICRNVLLLTAVPHWLTATHWYIPWSLLVGDWMEMLPWLCVIWLLSIVKDTPFLFHVYLWSRQKICKYSLLAHIPAWIPKGVSRGRQGACLLPKRLTKVFMKTLYQLQMMFENSPKQLHYETNDDEWIIHDVGWLGSQVRRHTRERRTKTPAYLRRCWSSHSRARQHHRRLLVCVDDGRWSRVGERWWQAYWKHRMHGVICYSNITSVSSHMYERTPMGPG